MAASRSTALLFATSSSSCTNENPQSESVAENSTGPSARRENRPDRDETGRLRGCEEIAARPFHGSSSQTAAYGPGVVLASAATSSATCHGARILPAMRAANRHVSFHMSLVLRLHSM